MQRISRSSSRFPSQIRVSLRQKSDEIPPITHILSKFISSHPSKGWDSTVQNEAHRTFLNWLGCTIGGSRTTQAEISLSTVKLLGSAKQSSILGRSDRVDMCSAAFVNGISSHSLDFDDSNLKTSIHPSCPIASAVVALAEGSPDLKATGQEVIDSIVIGIDVAGRIGKCITSTPDSLGGGWHITGSTGTVGAAAACARLLRLDPIQTMMALGIASSQPVGLREQYGSMTKALHIGAAARAGLMSALLAKQGFSSSVRSLEASRGFIQTISNKQDWNQITDKLGETFEISSNTYKPFACGIALHPTIDACTQLRSKGGFSLSDIQLVHLSLNPDILELTNRKEPSDESQAKFSIQHGAAVGLLYGKAGGHEFSNAIVFDPQVSTLRRKIKVVNDVTLNKQNADVTVVLNNGKKHHVFLENAFGSLERPMTDVHLTEKFTGLCDGILPLNQIQELISEVKHLELKSNILSIVSLATPTTAPTTSTSTTTTSSIEK